MVCIFAVPTNSYVEILVPNVMMLGRRALGRELSDDGRGLRNKIDAFIKEVPQSPLTHFHHVSIQEACDPERALT